MSKERQSKEKKKGRNGGKKQTKNKDETKMEDEFSSRAASLETIS